LALGLALGAGVAPLTVTIDEILLIVRAGTRAFDKSSTDEYGRPAIIFFAVAGPTPGRSTSSFSLAVFKSTFAPEAALDEALLACRAEMLEPIPPHTSAPASSMAQNL
jgi:hypothetical protein